MNNYPRGQEEREARGGFNLPRRSDLITPNPKLRLLDQVRGVMRLKHYSIRTEPSCCDWTKRSIHFHRMRSRDELLASPEAKIEDSQRPGRERGRKAYWRPGAPGGRNPLPTM